MSPEFHSPVGDCGRFRTTRWSAVLLSAQSQAPGSRMALAELCKIYWYPIYAFIRRRGYAVDDAQDLTQGFFLHLLDHKVLRKVNPAKGKFRSFLVALLHNYLSDDTDRARCLKRGGNIEFIALDAKLIEDRYLLASPVFLTPEKIFDARWAITLMDEALSRLRQEYVDQGKASEFETLRRFLDPVNSQAPLSYQELANALNISLGSVKILIHRLRKRYAALLREEVGRTVSEPSDVDGEIHCLCEALIAAEGHLDT